MEAELKAHQENIAAVAAATDALTVATANMQASEAALMAAVVSNAEAVKAKVADAVTLAFKKS